jgi:uncharacterized protein (UPF0332 family)
MATWQAIAWDSFQAAAVLLAQDHLRSCASRAYYAAYSAFADAMQEAAVAFPFGWRNPAHEQIIGWIGSNSSWPVPQRRRLARTMRRLRKVREIADYRPGTTLTRAEAIELVRESRVILRLLQVDHENSDNAGQDQ